MKKLLIAMVLMPLLALADTWTDPNTGITWAYAVSDGKAVIKDGSYAAISPATEGALTIPSFLGGSPVTSIGYRAFYYCRKLTSVTIPESVTSIGREAFAYCSGLTSVTVPSGVETIWDYAFSGCSGLTTVTLPDGVANVELCAFENCVGLTRMTLLSSVTTIGNSALYGCTSLKTIVVDGGDGERIKELLTASGFEVSGVDFVEKKADGGPYTETVDGIVWTYMVSGGKAQVGAGSSYSSAIPSSTTGAITIPSRLGDCPVTSIGDYAFYECCGLTSVAIPDGVTSIGDYAFSNCSGLTSVRIPSSVTSIGNYAFSNCNKLMSVTIPDGVTSIGSGAFWYCGGLTSVTIPEGVTSIGDYAFYYCSGLTSVTIPDGVTSIGNYAFFDCSGLTSVTIPPSVKSIGSYAFLNCNGLKEVHISDLAAWCDVVFSDSSANPLDYAGYLYLNDAEVVDLTIPEGVTNINSYAFDGCSGLTSVTIPSSVTSIGFGAFCGCSGLTSVVIPEGVTYIGGRVFSGCSGLTSVTLPSSVSSIGNSAFYGCSGLTSVVIPESVTSIGSYAFSGCSGLESVTIPSSVTNIGSYAFSSCSGLTSVAIPSGVTSIGSYAFYYCSGLTSVTIPESVTSIGSYAFYYCSGLTSVTISESVTSIGSYAFDGCSGLTEVRISDLSAWCNIWFGSFNANPLYYAKRLCLNGGEISELQIPEGVKGICNYAFYGCSGLTSVTIPSSVTSIGSLAFYRCSGLTSVTIPEGVTSIEDSTFSGCSGLTSVTIPSSVTSIGFRAFYGCSGLTSVTIPDGVISIGTYAFSGCTGLADEDGFVVVKGVLYDYYGEATSVAIPTGVTSIGYAAFSDCGALTSVTIPEGVTDIGDYAFSRCAQLRSVTIPSSMACIGSGAFATGSTLDKVVVSDLESYASICFADTTANPRNNAEALYVGDELRNEMCRVSYTLMSDDMYDYMWWYAMFNGYDEKWFISENGLTASCEVPIGTTVDFDGLSNGAITISEWSDHAFDGWEGDGVCVISDTEVVAKWRPKPLSDVIGMMGYGGSVNAFAEISYLFLDANSTCCRSQGTLHFVEDYMYTDSVELDWFGERGQLAVVMAGYDENGWEVPRTKSPVVKIMGQNTWTAELSDISQVQYISFWLVHSYYEGEYKLFNLADRSDIYEDVSNMEVRSPNVWHIELEDPYYYCYNQRYNGTYDQYFYHTSRNGIKTGDVLYVSCCGQYWRWNVWHDNDYLYVNMDCGQGVSEEVYGEHDGAVQGVPSFMWIVSPASPEEARERRVVTFETIIRASRSLYYYNYDLEIDPDIVTHQVDLNYGLYCDWNQMEDSPGELIIDDGLLPELPKVFPLPGWRFVGWSPDSSLPVTEDVEYVAQYEPITFGIAFEDVKGCENVNTNAYTVEDEVVFLPLADLPDWHFDGWSPATIPLGSTGDVTVVAQWRPIETAEIVGAWSEPRTFEYDGKVHGVDYTARLDVMEWPLNVVTQGTIRAVNVGEYAATAMAETVGVPETDTVYYRCAAVTNECTWTITPKPVTKLQIDYVSTAMIANGQQQKPQIVVRDVERGVVLTSADYALSYENNVEPGMGIARITGKGNYGGETTIEFPIVAEVSSAEGLNVGDGTFEIVGETDWVADNVVTHDRYASMRSGAIGDNEESALAAVVHGAGTVSFWWKVSSQHFDSVLELDRLEFYVDGVRQKWMNGDVDWTKLSFKVNGAGPHELKWVYAKDGSISEREDCGWVDEVSWEKEWLTGDWLNDVDREFATSNVRWVSDATVSSDGVGSMRSGACLQGQRSVLSTVVENVGTLTFKWKSSCVAYGEYITDKLSLLVDGAPVRDAGGKDIFINGETGWCDVSYRITGAGRHEVQWVFEKVSDASIGRNCGWVDVVRWDNEPGTLTDEDLVVDAFDGAYDGQGHGAAVSVKGVPDASVKYGASCETIGDAESPMFVNCGEHEVWFAVNVPDFNEYVGKAVVRIRPRSIEAGEVMLGAPLVYTGLDLTQDVASVVVDGLEATFEVSDNAARAAGAYQLTVAGTGNFCGELSVPFTVARAQAPSGDVTVEGYSPDAGAVEFTYDGKSHVPTVVAGYDGAAVVRFALTEEGPYADELNVSNAVERMDIWYEIVSANYERLVGRTQMAIRPLSVAGAEVVLGEQVSDVEGHVVQLVDSVIVNGLSATFAVSNNVATAEGDFELCVYGTGNFAGVAKCPYSVGGVVLPPLLTPGDGTIFAESQVVRFSAQTPESKWYYTLDGSMPTTNSQKASRVNLHGKTTIRAFAVLDGKLRSAVVEAHYALGACENPTVRLDGQDGCVFHFPGQLVVIDRNGEEGVVRYTLDGSEPTAASQAYEGPFAISASTTVRAKTFSDSWFDSETVTAVMRLEVLSVPSPIIRAASEYIGTRTTVSMSCALEGSVIRYTLDGSEPTQTSALYERPFEISGDIGAAIHVKARAFRDSYEDSPVAEIVVTRIWGIGDTLGVPDLMFTTDGWVVDRQETFGGRETMRSGPTDDGETDALETVVHGGGVVAFTWRTSCEDSGGDFSWDRVEFLVDDECIAKREGETAWDNVEYMIPNDGADHVLRWLYVKDSDLDTAEGEDCAWIGEINWSPSESVVDPTIEDDQRVTVRFDANGGEGAMEPVDCTHGVAQVLPANAFTRAGHVFAGWATSKDGEVVYADGAGVANLVSSGAVTLYARWARLGANAYAISFNANGGSNVMAPLMCESGRVYNLPECGFAKPEGKTRFAGWAGSNHKRYDNEMLVFGLGDVIMTAIWE